MAGTKIGGARAAATNKRKYGPNFYREIGRLGGTNGTTGGFYANRELARLAGAKGGRVGKRNGQSLPSKRQTYHELKAEEALGKPKKWFRLR